MAAMSTERLARAAMAAAVLLMVAAASARALKPDADTQPAASPATSDT